MDEPRIPIDLIISKMAESAGQVQEKAQRASDILTGELDTAISTTPYDVVYEEDRIQLKHYRPVADPQVQTPLLVVYALINRETMLDLQPGRSVVENLLQRGVDVYMIDWGYPTRKDRYLTIDDHVNGYMDNVIDFILKRHGIDQLNLMGICMGGTFSVIYSALHPGRIRNLITTVTPTHFDTDKGLLHIWMNAVDADQMVNTFGNMPGDLLNMGFLLLNPARLMLDKYVGFMEHMDNKGFVENFIRMEKWIFDSPDVPGETFRQFINDFYKENRLIRNELVVGGKQVDLNRVTMPLLNFYGKYDHLVPPEASDQLCDRVGSKDTEDICLDTGHIGIYVSSKCQRQFTPKIVSWLKERDMAPKRAPKRKKKAAPHKKTAASSTAKKTAKAPSKRSARRS